MSAFNTSLKKIGTFIFSVLAINVVCIPTAAAVGELARLVAIAEQILDRVNTLPKHIEESAIFMKSWQKTDKDDKESPTPELQTDFTNYMTAIDKNNQEQKKSQPDILKFFYHEGSENALTIEKVPYLNDLLYQNLLRPKSDLIFPNDPRKKTEKTVPFNPILSYVKNASGINITHVIPQTNWSGTAINQTRYFNFFSGISSVQTYNGYLLSHLYANYTNEDEVTKKQKELVDKVTDPDKWFTKIAAEDLGLVLRQILLFNSQIYVLLTQILETEKQMLTAQAMNNTLLILLNLQGEDILVKKADGSIPT